MITPVNSKSPPNQAGDIYYSTVLRFVKRICEVFSIFLRAAPSHPLPDSFGFFIVFEENTGSRSNRYHIIYTQSRALSSRFHEKYAKKSDFSGSRCHCQKSVKPQKPQIFPQTPRSKLTTNLSKKACSRLLAVPSSVGIRHIFDKNYRFGLDFLPIQYHII